jgi:TetR/AcrR family transcriptional regulator, ethionamide resistance regulator
MDMASIIDVLSRSVKGVSLRDYPPDMSAKSVETVQARSGRRRRQATIADLLDATRRLLIAGTPVASLSVERIVAEAGVARATFYLHFADKHALIARLAEDEFAWRERIGVEALADPNLERTTLDAIMLEIVSQWATDRPILAAIIELAEYDAHVNAIWAAAMHQVAATAAQQFRRRWASSTGAPTDPDTTAEIFTWMFERCCHQMLRGPTDVERIATGMAEIIWRVLDYQPHD